MDFLDFPLKWKIVYGNYEDEKYDECKRVEEHRCVVRVKLLGRSEIFIQPVQSFMDSFVDRERVFGRINDDSFIGIRSA